MKQTAAFEHERIRSDSNRFDKTTQQFLKLLEIGFHVMQKAKKAALASVQDRFVLRAKRSVSRPFCFYEGACFTVQTFRHFRHRIRYSILLTVTVVHYISFVDTTCGEHHMSCIARPHWDSFPSLAPQSQNDSPLFHRQMHQLHMEPEHCSCLTVLLLRSLSIL